ncbi:hypothetical protein XO10_09625 [Marinitoga sp. 1135]|uniref:hypothetical protein n=1 Tax=Marinitoga sp. 1137 TaxID=1545835 RepID=UPI000309D3E8|nr:hypothetical protein [Marinitoga sp. 1137]APT76725.1 hypothetical protein LN42_10320 [Marinitoga sp. 1137]NUU96502.1 hypothetical protein [Marinitoga sp. 1135]NUU98421.1 hypothetical protein [Marinitoga sp. 1138]
MKSIYYNPGTGKSIPIIIKKGKYKEYINVKKSNIIIYDKKIKLIDELNLSNSISVIGNENLKSFDKYLSLIMKLSDKNIKNVVIVGGYSVIDLLGYTMESFERRNEYIYFPSTLQSAIMPPLRGKYYLNFNWKKDFLVQKGYPDAIIIDTTFFESLSPQELKKGFVIPYLLGRVLNSRISKIALNYSKLNFSDIDLEEFIYYSLKQWVYYIENESKVFPGENIIKLFYNKKTGINRNFLDIFGLSFLIELYMSWYFGFLEYELFEEIKKELIENFDIQYKNIEYLNFDEANFNNEFVLFTSSGRIINYKTTYDELNIVLKEIKNHFRGGFL